MTHSAFAGRRRSDGRMTVICFETEAERDRWLEFTCWPDGGARYQAISAPRPTEAVSQAIAAGYWREDAQAIYLNGHPLLDACYEAVR